MENARIARCVALMAGHGTAFALIMDVANNSDTLSGFLSLFWLYASAGVTLAYAALHFPIEHKLARGLELSSAIMIGFVLVLVFIGFGGLSSPWLNPDVSTTTN